MLKSKIIFLIILLIAVSFTIEAASKVIGVSLLTREHQFYRDLEKGLRTEAAEKGYKVINRQVNLILKNR